MGAETAVIRMVRLAAWVCLAHLFVSTVHSPSQKPNQHNTALALFYKREGSVCFKHFLHYHQYSHDFQEPRPLTIVEALLCEEGNLVLCRRL